LRDVQKFGKLKKKTEKNVFQMQKNSFFIILKNAFLHQSIGGSNPAKLVFTIFIQLPQRTMLLTSKVVKSSFKIIILLRESKTITHSVNGKIDQSIVKNIMLFNFNFVKQIA